MNLHVILWVEVLVPEAIALDLRLFINGIDGYGRTMLREKYALTIRSVFVDTVVPESDHVQTYEDQLQCLYGSK